MAQQYGGGYTYSQAGQGPPPPPPVGWNPAPPVYGQQDQGQGQQGGYGGFAPPPPPMHFPPPGGAYQQGGADVEANYGKQFGMGFDDRAIRQAFIRKVFSLLTIMLLVVVGMIALFRFQEDCANFVRTNIWPYYVSYVVFLVVYIALMCCESVRRSFPTNLICLAVLTLSIGFMTAMITAFYETEVVLLSLGICVVVCGSIILFAMFTKYDFTSCMGVMFVVFMVVFVFGIFVMISSIWFHSPILYLIYAGAMALVFMVVRSLLTLSRIGRGYLQFLAIDVQMLVGGKKLELSPEEYIFATVQLFMDIVYIFWFILQIVGGVSNN